MFVAGLAEGGPAHKAGVEPGDLVLEVAGTRVTDLADRSARSGRSAPPAPTIPLTIAREGSPNASRSTPPTATIS